jgi:hypothetical protein
MKAQSQYSVKDIGDFVKSLNRKYGENLVIVDTLFDKKVSHSNVAPIKARLQQTSINDKVILAYSCHGLLSDSLDYYLSVHPLEQFG